MRRIAIAGLILIGAAFIAVVILVFRTPNPTYVPSPEGPGVVVVPDVVGMAEARAVSELTVLGLYVSVIQERSETIAKERVIRTTPAADSLVSEGSRIEVFVSSGS
jgi:beta-lactam-binding protein with PASTA domain